MRWWCEILYFWINDGDIFSEGLLVWLTTKSLAAQAIDFGFESRIGNANSLHQGWRVDCKKIGVMLPFWLMMIVNITFSSIDECQRKWQLSSPLCLFSTCLGSSDA